MSPDDLDSFRRIVEEVVEAEDPFRLWLYFVVIIVAAIAGFFSSFASKYLQVKGQNLATKEDFKELLAQTQATTKLTEDVKAQVATQRALDNEIRMGQYKTATALYGKLVEITTNINRMKHGTEVPGFMNKNDIVPLTEVYEELTAKHFLLGDTFYQNLNAQANLALQLANVPATNKEASQAKAIEFRELQQEFGKLMIATFGIDELLAPQREEQA